jgi:chromosome segregation ATPase
MPSKSENLVDQINRMTDEREELFGKMDSLQARLIAANQLNEQLKVDVDSANARFNDMQQQIQQVQHPKSGGANDDQYIVKIDLLENEIK